MRSAQRSVGIDRARAIAALCVIGLHTGAPGQPADLLQTAVQMGSRWAVPFFFVVAGYMMSEAERFAVRAGENGLVRLVRIAVVANLLYWPVAASWAAITHQPYWPLPRLIAAGTFFHLWFLHGLIVASLLMRLSAGRRWRAVCLVSAAVLLAGYWVIDLGSVRGWVPYETMILARIMSGTAYVAIGIALRGKHAPAAPAALGLLAAGVAFLVVDATLFGVWRDNAARQVFVGVPVLGVAVLLLALCDTAPAGPLARLGQRDALAIYLLHPLLIVALMVVARSAPAPIRALLLNWELRTAVVMAGTLALVFLLHRFLPAPLRWLNGDWGNAREPALSS